MSYLYQAHFKRYTPRVWVQDGIVTIKYRRFPLFDRLVNLYKPSAEITLNGSILWEIEFRNGVSDLKADLEGLTLRSQDILGSANHIDLALSKPAGSLFIYISGGISKSTISRPIKKGVRVRVNGGISELELDDQHFGTIDREIILVSPGFKNTTDRYDICIVGGARNLVINEEM